VIFTPKSLFAIPTNITIGCHFWCCGRGGVAVGQEEEEVVLIQPLLVDGAGLSRVEYQIMTFGSDLEEIKGVGLEFS
jgi:hypothetical protein